MTGETDRKEGELSEEESALAKKFFAALGFILAAAIIVGFESFVDLPYVMFGVILVGITVVVKVSFNTGNDVIESPELTK